jgi:type VI secretion system protein VasJ
METTIPLTEDSTPEVESTPEVVLSALLQDVQVPIAGENSAGSKVDPYEDNDLAAIKVEIEKMSNIGGEVDHEKLTQQTSTLKGNSKDADIKGTASAFTADFQLIVDRSRNILRSKSKNLLILAYMNVGLARTEGIFGIAEGMRALDIFRNSYWDNGFPTLKQMRLRGNALTFLFPKWKEWLELRFTPVMGDDVHIQDCLDVLSELSGFFMKNMGEFAPATTEIKGLLERHLRNAPKSAPPPPPPSETPAPSSDTTSSSTNTAAPTSSGEGVNLSLEDDESVRRSLLEIGSHLQKQDPKNPLGYKLNRLAIWSEVNFTPMSGVFEPPYDFRVEFLLNELPKESPSTIISVIEEQIQDRPYHLWIDLQRILVQALEKAGEEYAEVRQTILMETAFLLKRVPDLPKVTFNNDLAFATSATINWIEEVVMPVLASGEGGGGNLMMTASEEESSLVAEFQAAQKAVGQGGIANAVARLQNGMESDLSGRARFRRRFLVAVLCMKNGEFRVAAPLLESLIPEIEQNRLDRWEPALALDVWANLYKCYGMMLTEIEGDAAFDMLKKQQHIFDKMCQTDVRYALASLGQRANTKPAPQVAEIPNEEEPALEESPDVSEGSEYTPETYSSEEDPEVYQP